MSLPPDDPADEARQEELPEDYDTPFNMPDEGSVDIADSAGGVPKRPVLDDTHPATDSNFEISEAYQDGMSLTADASEPNAGDTVIGYKTADAEENDDTDMAA